MPIDDALIRVKAYITENNIPKLRFAKMSGVPEATIRGIFTADANPRISTIRRLESIIPDDYEVK